MSAPDPRIGLGVELAEVGPPFRVRRARRTSPDEGGTLDLGLVGTLPDGREVVVGELWAMGPDSDGQRRSLDVQAHAEKVLSALNPPQED